MSLASYNSTPFGQNLLSLTNSLMTQPNIAPDLNIKGNTYITSEEDIFQSGSGKKPKQKKETKPKKEKKVKEIDTYLKPQLEKIAKKNDVNLKNRDGTIKNKQQLFNSLKRKNLI
jgi:hypothetical protein